MMIKDIDGKLRSVTKKNFCGVAYDSYSKKFANMMTIKTTDGDIKVDLNDGQKKLEQLFPDYFE